MAQGGRIGLSDGQLVRNTADGSRPGYEGPLVGSKKGIFTSEAMDNVSDAILKAYADDDISLLFEKSKVNPTGLISPKDAKQGIFSKIKIDQDRLSTIVKNTGLDQETVLNIIDDRDAYNALEKGSSSQATRYKDRTKFPTGEWCGEGDFVAYGRHIGHKFIYKGIRLLLLFDDQIIMRVQNPEDLDIMYHLSADAA